MKNEQPKAKFDAWILDATAEEAGIRLWLKQPSGITVMAIHPYHPAFYAAFRGHPPDQKPPRRDANDECQSPQEDSPYAPYLAMLADDPGVFGVSLVSRYVKAGDLIPRQVLEIRVKSPFHLKALIQRIDQLELFDLYNTDLPLTQMYYYETGLFPFARCSISALQTNKGLQIRDIRLRDSNEEIHYDLPPLRVLWLELEIETAGIVPTKTDPIRSATITVDPSSAAVDLAGLSDTLRGWVEVKPATGGDSRQAGFHAVIRGENERHMLQNLEKAILGTDPDVIFTSSGDDTLFPLLLARISYLGLERAFSLSRDRSPLVQNRFQVKGGNSFMSYGVVYHRAKEQFYLGGRLHIDSSIYGGLHFDDGNLYGIIEVARVCYVPLQRLTRVTIGGALQSLQFYHAYVSGVLIPAEKKNSEHFRDGAALLQSDRGGHILQPKIGLFERVAELDYTSMYPALMVHYNVSPEMLNCQCCKGSGHQVPGLPYWLCKQRKGIVPLSLRVPLTKRIAYKALAKSSPNPAANRYKKMEEALKWILVVCFGYLGFRNARFGRIEAHQTVCAYAREFLLNAVEIVERHGLGIIHGIVDSLYVQAPPGMPLPEFHEHCTQAAAEITSKTHIPLNYDPHGDYFDFICFLPTKQDPQIGALTRYWGMKSTGGLKIRGIEIRRHDTPPLIKQFQEEVMVAIGTSSVRNNPQQLLASAVVPILMHYFQVLESGTIPPEELAITIRLTRSPEAYKVQNYQAIAAAQLKRQGKPMTPGQQVSFVITNDKAENPDERVQPLELFLRSGQRYDMIKYKDLLVRAVTNLLPVTLSEEIKHHLAQLSPNRLSIRAAVQKPLSEFF